MTYNQQLSSHRGVDIANDFGTPVVAVGVGTVFYAGEDIETLFGLKPDFYGRVVVIETPDGLAEQSVEILPGELSGVVLQVRP